MNRIVFSVALAMCWAASARAQDATIDSASAADVSAVMVFAAAHPVHQAAGVARLRKHGDRFAKVIALIELEAAKPGWGWDGDCDLPESNGDQDLNW